MKEGGVDEHQSGSRQLAIQCDDELRGHDSFKLRSGAKGRGDNVDACGQGRNATCRVQRQSRRDFDIRKRADAFVHRETPVRECHLRRCAVPGRAQQSFSDRLAGKILHLEILAVPIRQRPDELGLNVQCGNNGNVEIKMNFYIVIFVETDTNYDHLLFLLGLLVVARGFASSLKIITGFTIAHSFTLALATFGLARIPSRIVEPLIAASIVYVGVDNLLRGDNPQARQLLTFGFGFIHGFGFASALRETGIGSRTGGIVLPLLSFNVGVELGQIMVAAAALPIIWKLRESPVFIARWAPACSATVVLLGSFWFVERLSMN